MEFFSFPIHPRRTSRNFFRFINKLINNRLFLLKCKFYHVDCVIGDNSFLRHCSVEAKQKNGKLEIGANCLLENTFFGFYGIGAKIVVNNDVHINARPKAKTYLFVKGDSRIVIDEGCLLSNAIEISSTDWHSVIDEQGERVNYEKDVYIGKHVWIGRKAIICKGVSINENSVIGAGSVVTKPFFESNAIIAGNPAKVRKSNVNWQE